MHLLLKLISFLTLFRILPVRTFYVDHKISSQTISNTYRRGRLGSEGRRGEDPDWIQPTRRTAIVLHNLEELYGGKWLSFAISRALGVNIEFLLYFKDISWTPSTRFLFGCIMSK